MFYCAGEGVHFGLNICGAEVGPKLLSYFGLPEIHLHCRMGEGLQNGGRVASHTKK